MLKECSKTSPLAQRNDALVCAKMLYRPKKIMTFIERKFGHKFPRYSIRVRPQLENINIKPSIDNSYYGKFLSPTLASKINKMKLEIIKKLYYLEKC